MVASRPAAGPLHGLASVVQERLAKENVALHLVWRPEDARTPPLAQAGYFAFWQGAREQLPGQETGPASDLTSRNRRKGKGKQKGARRE